MAIEVCIDSVESALAAQCGGADRVELCANLFEGGTTPSVGVLQVIKRTCPGLPVYVLIRPRGGDFIYSDLEFEVMIQDMVELKARGADGFVFGVLTSSGHVDKERCRKLMEQCQPLPATFHRAFDMCQDPASALEDIISLGFQRLLTSGQDSTVLEGLPLIKTLIELAAGRIVVMPGGGITERNLQRILDGCGATEFHCSARSARQSPAVFRNSSVSMGAALRPPEYSVKYADEDLIRRLRTIQRNDTL
ncbi:copper homeostasis protein cutC homolog [Diadema setosum]|uniref:copper homeostasis protein cutC homolog n=1 Tax=Diadema setosum TaxID=31175 RepID=UPI003B3AEB28